MLRNIVITINNPLQNGGLEICDWLEEHAQFVILGCETGEGVRFTGKDMRKLKQPCRWSTLERLAFRWHIERRLGTQAEAIRYCQKKTLTMFVMEGDENRDPEETSTEYEESLMRMACELCVWLEICSRSE